jgi:predicted NUDIX family NTP pyrophosphohydrolase
MSANPQRSAGILLYRLRGDELQVLLGHPGGPFFRNKQDGAWSIPKGLVEPDEEARTAALREFAEETGYDVDASELLDLGEVTLRSGKIVAAWAAEGDLDPDRHVSNPVRLEWPRRSGRVIEFPEIDEVRWCNRSEAEKLLNPRQLPLLDRLDKSLNHAT